MHVLIQRQLPSTPQVFPSRQGINYFYRWPRCRVLHTDTWTRCGPRQTRRGVTRPLSPQGVTSPLPLGLPRQTAPQSTSPACWLHNSHSDYSQVVRCHPLPDTFLTPLMNNTNLKQYAMFVSTLVRR